MKAKAPWEPKRWFYSPVYVLFMAVFAAFAAGVGSRTFHYFRGETSVERQIEKMVSHLNKRTPIQLDTITRCDRVEVGPGKAFSYVFTLSKDLTGQAVQAMRESVPEHALADPDPEMQALFAAGVTVWYKYYDTSGKKVLEIPVKK